MFEKQKPNFITRGWSLDQLVGEEHISGYSNNTQTWKIPFEMVFSEKKESTYFL